MITSDGEADSEETASDAEAGDDSPVASDAGKRPVRHDDSTESSDGADGAGVEDDEDSGRAVASPAAADSDSDRATRGGPDLERGKAAPAPVSRGKSPAPEFAEQNSGGGVRVFVDLSSSSEPDSEGSSSMPASKPGVSSRRTKELEEIGRASCRERVYVLV